MENNLQLFILKHLPALQVLLPFFGAIIAALSFNKKLAWWISTIFIFFAFVLSIFGINYVNSDPISYNFGGWQAPVGIEYRIDILNQPIIIFFNGILLFFLIFGKELINNTVLKYIDEQKQYIFYSLLLFAHAGYLGVISTNDLFNIYVFIEISSLATYVIISQGKSSFALIGAFDYLIIGTIGATMILIAIGFLYGLTGSLNITDVANILKIFGLSKISITAITFFLSGVILKMAFFPMHFWMRRAYSVVAPIILTYLAAISSIFGVYLIIRFYHFTIDNQIIQANISDILRPIALFTIIICSVLAIRARNIREVVIYSTNSQVGYIFLLITISHAQAILFQLLIFDAINKIALFIIVAHLDSKTNNLSFDNFACIKKSSLFKILIALALIFSSGLPITSMFIFKVQFFSLLIEQKMIVEFFIVLAGTVLSMLYHLKIAKAIFFNNNKNESVEINSNLSGLIVIIIAQIMSLIYINDFSELTVKTRNFINSDLMNLV
ncbi:MAG: cation:proton antiporter [Rickettsiales bacterium]|nr:MAG: cation:proton antiporter [Rickettsiales bacterium]